MPQLKQDGRRLDFRKDLPAELIRGAGGGGPLQSPGEPWERGVLVSKVGSCFQSGVSRCGVLKCLLFEGLLQRCVSRRSQDAQN